jgi:predicted dehydrogenase
MNVGVIGLGYWGPNIVRNFLGNKDVKKVIACDQKQERLKFIQQKFPTVKVVDDVAAFYNGSVDIIAIATPVQTHFALAKKALEAGKHIWVEKPFTLFADEARTLIDLADKKRLKIFVDHTFIYTGAVRKMKELVDKGELGDISYFDSVRINLGLFQHDVNVVWDLAPHDLSIMKYVLNEKKIIAISAHGIANYYDQENIAHISVYLENNCYAHFHVNWTSPVKIRRTIIGGRKRMLVFDDLLSTEKLKVYDSSVQLNSSENINDALAQYRIGDMYSPKLKEVEALSEGVKEFISSIQENRKPLTSGEDGLEIVQLLEASEKSIKNNGMLVKLK